jgi:hypothetical protein|nr:MAG TPA: Kelch repeat [Caudoviricetes sp.]
MPAIVNTVQKGGDGDLKSSLRLTWYSSPPDSPAFQYSSGIFLNGNHYIQHTTDNIWKYHVKDKRYERLNTGGFGLHGNYSKLVIDLPNNTAYSITGDESKLIYVYVLSGGLSNIETYGGFNKWYLLNGFRLGQFYPIVWNSKIYTFGGTFNGGVTSTVYEIDPTDNKFTWSQYSTLPVPLRYPNVTFDGVENVYITCGSINTGTAFSDKFIRFNIRTKESVDLPKPGHGATGFGGYLNYVGKGRIHYACGQGTPYREMFYIEENKWVRLENGFISCFAASIYDPTEDAVHVHGGHTGTWNTYHTVYKM